MSFLQKYHEKILSTTFVLLIALSGIKLYYWYRKQSFLNMLPPKKWKKIGILKDILIYPIKSCSGININSAKCDILGLKTIENVMDRKFAILDSNTGKVISARQHSKLLKVQIKLIKKNIIIVQAPKMNNLEINLNEIINNEENSFEMQETYLWGSKVVINKCGSMYDKWFSQFLFNKNDGANLVYYKFNEPTKEIIDMLKDENFLKRDTGALQDTSSYMIINENSIDDLNKRLKNEDKIHFKQFRPNFLIKTDGPPYDEDNWNWIKIGDDVIFRCIAPSYRCMLTTLNHLTAERNLNNEPLKTLNTYRIWGKQKYPRMGILLGLRNEGSIKINDNVYIES